MSRFDDRYHFPLNSLFDLLRKTFKPKVPLIPFKQHFILEKPWQDTMTWVYSSQTTLDQVRTCI